MMGRVLAIGNFDGVHLGHQAILSEARKLAGPDGTVIAVTFWPHPTSIVRPSETPALLCRLSDRVRLLKAGGADEVSIVEFTHTLASTPPQDFVERVLCSLHPSDVVVGENFRFGVGAQAGGQQMSDYAQGRFQVTVMPLLAHQGRISSSRIRTALVAGDVEQAAGMLGRFFRYQGIVVLGDQRGRELGFPTANLTVPDRYACPADGVYAGYLHWESETWPAAISVGTNPTFDGDTRRVEAYALDQCDLHLYGDKVGVDFVARLRSQMRFSSPQDLISQMNHDVEATRKALTSTPGRS
ncbi:MAG: bifunctional riboflavin kinase/FAD synthetase [Propionibacteriaceae bacterium]|nr:bifunctional riboflavin kinase/FAD synthetase [Propionibacteriaceae bacterium]